MKNRSTALPIHTFDYESIFRNATREALERAIAGMKSKISENFRTCELPPRARRFADARCDDLRRAGVPTGAAARFAEAETRIRMQIALVAGDESLIEKAISEVELLPGGEIEMRIHAPTRKDMTTEFKMALGMDVRAARL